MSAIPYAFSVHHFISSVGADAGFAAVIGLALVVLLFFAHARETSALRHRADEAEDALHRLELYVDQLARSGPAPAATPAPSPAFMGQTSPGVTPAPSSARIAPAQMGGAAPVAARTITPAPVVAGVPVAPAGVGAPALSAATRLIPAADDGAIAIRASRSSPVAQPMAAGQTTAAVMDPPAPRPSTAAAGAAAAGAAAGAGNGAGRYPPAPERMPVRPIQGRPTAAVTGSARGRAASRDSGSRIGRGAIALAAVLAVVIAAVVVLVLSSSGAGKTGAARTTPAPSTSVATRKSKAKSKTQAALVTPASVTVAVLNGTSTTNLAHDISQKLATVGYKLGNIATASDQTVSSTIVGYLPNDKRDALAVAKSLKLGTASVQAVDQSSRTVACNGSATACSAQVVVTVGSDLASNA